MNKLAKAFLFLVIATVMMINTVAMSATVEVGDNGALRAVNSPYVLRSAQKKAYRNKGTIVPIITHNVFARDGILHMKRLRVIIGVVYDNTGVHLVHNVKKPQTVWNWYVIFLVISLILLIPEIYFVRRGKKKGEEDNKGAKIISILITLILTIAAVAVFIGFYDVFAVTSSGWSIFISGISIISSMFLAGMYLLDTFADIKGLKDFKFVMGICAILAILSLGMFFIS